MMIVFSSFRPAIFKNSRCDQTCQTRFHADVRGRKKGSCHKTENVRLQRKLLRFLMASAGAGYDGNCPGKELRTASRMSSRFQHISAAFRRRFVALFPVGCG